MPKSKATSKRKTTQPQRDETGQCQAHADRQISALTALLKQAQGKSLSLRERRDVAWHEELERSRHVADWQAAIPKGEYCRLADRQHKLIDDAAKTYKLPLGDAFIDLRAALKAIHDFIAANAYRLRDPTAGLELSELKARRLEQEVIRADQEIALGELKLKREHGDLIHRADLQQALVTISAKLRTIGKSLSRIDQAAVTAFNEGVEALAKEIEKGSLRF